MVGRAISHNHVMCPKPRAPISTTAASVASGALTSVSGTPSSLLNDFSLAAVTSRCRAIAVNRSLVEVLPFDPVMATTRSGRRRRASFPSSVSAASVASTSTAG